MTQNEGDDEIGSSDTGSECSFMLDGDGNLSHPKTAPSNLFQAATGSEINFKEYSRLFVYPTIYKKSQGDCLEIVANDNSTNQTQNALFTWFHIEDENLDFEKFQSFVKRKVGNDQSRKLEKLLHDLKPQMDMVEIQGRSESPVDSCFRYYADNRRRRTASGPRAKTLWLCFPYFSIEKPRPSTQSTHSNASLELEVVFPDSVSLDAPYFRISRFWCLITGDKMFTYGRVPRSTLIGPGRPIELAPDNSNDADTQDRNYFRVLDRGNQMYLLTAQSCRSWLAFKIQILNAVSERYSNDKRHVYYNGDPVTAENWRELDLVEKAKKGDVILVLKYQDQPEDCYYHSPESSESTSESRGGNFHRLTPIDETSSHGRLSPKAASESGSGSEEQERLEILFDEEGDSDAEAEELREALHSKTGSTVDYGRYLLEPDWESELRNFRVFTWICATPVHTNFTEDCNHNAGNESSRFSSNRKQVEPAVVDQQKLERCLQAAHDHLSSREGYMSCQGRDYAQTAWDESEVLSHAKCIFELFLPLRHRSAIAEKYWGGFHRNYSELKSMDPWTSDLLEDCASTSRNLQNELSNGYGPSALELIVPHSLYNAFLSITCFMTGYDHESSLARRELLGKFKRQIEQGCKMITRSIALTPLSEKEAILPTGILARILRWLIEGACGEDHNKLDTIYQNFIDELEEKAHLRVSDEKDEMAPWPLMKDIKRVKEMTTDQENLLLKIESYLAGTLHHRSGPESLPSLGKQSAMLSRVMSAASVRQEIFEDLAQKRASVEKLHYKNYIARKDDQEAASLTFAIVSVIFLPLTTVASILGMNTREVRDMQQTQWVFWATGIPLAILTGMFCLWCTSRFNKFKQWFRNHLFPRSQSVNTNLTRSENRMGLQITSPGHGPDSNGEQISTIRRRWKRSKNREDQANNQV